MTPVILRLRELRHAKGWSQMELARRAGVRQATVSRLEGRSLTNVNLAILEKLANALQVDPGYLLVKVRKDPNKGPKAPPAR